MAKYDINMQYTGVKIRRLMIMNGYDVNDIQHYLELNCPQSIYKWLRGESLPTVYNLYLLSHMFRIPMEAIIGIEGIDDELIKECKLTNEEEEEKMKKKEEPVVEAGIENIRRYDFKDDVFYVISDKLYFQGIYNLYEVCTETPIIEDKIYSNEEYIRLDPDNFIEAIKLKEKRIEKITRK